MSDEFAPGEESGERDDVEFGDPGDSLSGFDPDDLPDIEKPEVLGTWRPASHRGVAATPEAVVIVGRSVERVPYRAVTGVSVETTHSPLARTAYAAAAVVALGGLLASGLDPVPTAVGLAAAAFSVVLVATGWYAARHHDAITTVTIDTAGRGHAVTFEDAAEASALAAHVRAFALDEEIDSEDESETGPGPDPDSGDTG